MMDQIRTLKPEELDDSITLSSFAFQYEVTPEEREERKRRMNPDRLWGYFVDGRLAAKMQIHDMQSYIQGKALRMGGVAGVATWPEYRRQGMVARLIARGLQAMKEDGQTLSCLHPFSVAFYRKYGWELYTDYKKYSLVTAQLPKENDTAGRVGRAGLDWELFNRVYDRYARQYNGTLVRDESWWRHSVFRQKKGEAAVYYGEDGDPRGYVLYNVKNRLMDIQELVFLDDSARRGLWRFIANHDSMCDKVTLTAPADDDLPYLLPDPRIGQETVPYFMARIVDFPAFVGHYTFAATGEEQQLYVRIADPTAPWNDGLFRLHIGPAGEATAERMAAEPPAGEGEVRCGIGTMTAMLMGYKRPSALQRAGLLDGDEAAAERWERVVPRSVTYLLDYF